MTDNTTPSASTDDLPTLTPRGFLRAGTGEFLHDAFFMGPVRQTVATTLVSLEDAHAAILADRQARAAVSANAFPAMRALTEALLTRADADYLYRQIDAAVKVMADHGCSPPVPWPDESFGIDRLAALATIQASASASQEPVAMTDQEIDNAVHKGGGRWNGDAWVIEDADLYPLVRMLLATQVRPASGETWKPINSAPKDGRSILVIDDAAAEPMAGVAHWSEETWRGGHAREWEMYPRADEQLGCYPAPTRWHELPTSSPSENNHG